MLFRRALIFLLVVFLATVAFSRAESCGPQDDAYTSALEFVLETGGCFALLNGNAGTAGAERCCYNILKGACSEQVMYYMQGQIDNFTCA